MVIALLWMIIDFQWEYSCINNELKIDINELQKLYVSNL